MEETVKLKGTTPVTLTEAQTKAFYEGKLNIISENGSKSVIGMVETATNTELLKVLKLLVIKFKPDAMGMEKRGAIRSAKAAIAKAECES